MKQMPERLPTRKASSSKGRAHAREIALALGGLHGRLGGSRFD
jgi:hypothetical protein